MVKANQWWYKPIEIPLTEDGDGPATVGVDATKVIYEVWDPFCNTHFACENLLESICEAQRLNEENCTINDGWYVHRDYEVKR